MPLHRFARPRVARSGTALGTYRLRSRVLVLVATVVLVPGAMIGCHSEADTPGTSAAATPTGSDGATGSSPAAAATPAQAPASTDSPSGTLPSPARAAGGMTSLPSSCPPDSLLENDLGLDVVSTGGASTAACVYTGARLIVSINFVSTPGMTAAQAEARAKAQSRTAGFQKVPGVGDAAFYDTPAPNGHVGSYIAVLSGSVSFHIVATASVPVSKMAKAAQDIIKAG